ncbi:uncharacterized protein N7500_001710 [Penicillium coprophilum]|uniref:uncharacterized protein n=1 Tax=Penicillium coprophilum TaxID=36646 RepID=UPI00239F4D67|nr:uncharacterized protein N7500_001710 [Penicillium coprophilum]KAJ5173779.1 hypothetical protein N7500_001710 [Penicillium coprophilum]
MTDQTNIVIPYLVKLKPKLNSKSASDRLSKINYRQPVVNISTGASESSISSVSLDRNMKGKLDRKFSSAVN